VADIVQYQLGLFAMQSGKPPMTQTAASIFQEICYANKDRLSYVTIRLSSITTSAP
jgi:20S proteasome subunit beta 1